MKHPKVIAVLCSDIHLDERPPAARTAEDNWWDAMRRPLAQLRTLKDRHSCPVVCAGDVFNHWKAPPELINFALDELPEMYAIPGQHDLPFHAMKDIGKSAFGTLVQAGKIKLLPYMIGTPIPGAILWGYHWNADIVAPKFKDSDFLNVAVVHAYVWAKGYNFPGAPEEKRVGAYLEKMQGFDVALFGDNHKGFKWERDGLTIFNHGGFMRRKIDEVDWNPSFGLLMSDGTVQLVKQDCAEDKFIAREEAKFEEEQEFKMAAFLKELNTLGKTELDFVEAVQHYLKTYEVSPGAAKLILQSIHHGS